jgi:uncharacterized protein DUF2683
MVQALVTLNDNINRVLNIVKAKYELNDKSQAIEFVVNEYIKYVDEPELRPDFIKEMKKTEKEKSIRVEDFEKRYGLNV